MPLVNAYCTEQQLRDQFDDNAETLSSNLLIRAINATSRGIDNFCGRRFWLDETPTTRRYRPEDSELAWVHDIGSTEGLVIATDTTGNGTYATVWDESDYELAPLDADQDGPAYAWWRIEAVDRHLFPTSGRRPPLRVLARHGWSAIADGVEQGCILRSAAIFKRKESIDGISGFGDMGVVRISYRRDPDVVELLSDYMRIGVGSV